MNDYLNSTLLTVHYVHSVELTTSQSNTYFAHAQWDQLRSWLYKVISFPTLEPKTIILGNGRQLDPLVRFN